jgi:hypothetical protein
LREEHRLRVSENRVPRRIFGPKRDEVIGEWRKLHNEELRDLYSPPSVIRIDQVKQQDNNKEQSHTRNKGTNEHDKKEPKKKEQQSP